MKRLWLVVIIFLAWQLALVPAGAQEPQAEMKLSQMELAVFEELKPYEISSVHGIEETLKVDDRKLVAIRLKILPVWTDQIDKINVDDKDIKLVTPQGDEILMIGEFERYGQFRLNAQGFYAYRPNNWKEKEKNFYYNAVFAVPRDLDKAEFKMGPVGAAIKIPNDSKAPPLASDTVQVVITGVGKVESIRNEKRVGTLEPRPQTVITNPHGDILEVKIKITPVQGNGDEPDHFFWYTPWLSLATENGRFIGTFGEMFMNKITNNVSHNLSRNSDGEWSSGEATLYFAVPKSISAFKLIYVGQPVAEGRI